MLCLTFILLHNSACGLHRGNNVEWRERVGRVGWVRARLDSTSEGIRYIRGDGGGGGDCDDDDGGDDELHIRGKLGT